MAMVRFNIDKLPDFFKKFASVNEKLGRYSLPTIKIADTKEVHQITSGGLTEKWIEININGPEVMKRDCSYVGTITFNEGIRQVFTLKGEDVVLGAIPDSELRCDHCHTNRKRVKYFFFRENDKLVCIGSSCAKDYFGWDIERYLDMYTSLVETGSELENEDNGDGAHRSSLIYIDDLILATYIATDEWKGMWVSRDKTEVTGGLSSGQIVFLTLYPSKDDTETIELKRRLSASLPKEFYDNVKAKIIEKYGNIDPKNDFEWNLFSNCFSDKNELRDFVVSPGAVAYTIYNTMHEIITMDTSKSEFLGIEGDRITRDITVTEIKSISTQYGHSLLVMMADDEGNVLKSFTTSAFFYNVKVGDKLRVSGIVKSHDMFKGIKSTLITRIKGETI